MAKTKKAKMKSAETTSNLGTAGGVAAGAALGSLLGPIGAAVGAVVGGIAGAKVGKGAQAKLKPKRKLLPAPGPSRRPRRLQRNDAWGKKKSAKRKQ